MHLILNYLLKKIGQSLQCIQCGNQGNNFECVGSDSGTPIQCPDGISYCFKATALGRTFKQCGLYEVPEFADMCTPDIVRISSLI